MDNKDFKFNIKAKSKPSAANYFRKIYNENKSKEYEDISSIIAPTVFELNNIKEENAFDKTFEGECKISFNYLSYKSKPFTRYSRDLLFYVDTLSKGAVKLLILIGDTIKWNSNIYRMDYTEIQQRLHCSVNSIKDLCTELVKHSILAKTDVPKTFIVNHNVVFYGDYTTFMNNYNKAYNGKKAIFDEYGRIPYKNINKG